MSRHNRRRTRHRATLPFTFELPLLLPPPTAPTFTSAPPPVHIHVRPNAATRLEVNRWQSNQTLARQWHRQCLAAERLRIFGGSFGEEADDEGLCGKMMEFFGGLDFIHG